MTTRRRRGTGGASVKRRKGSADPRKKVPTGHPGTRRTKGYATRRRRS